jgi:hypothetical protein
VQTLLPQTSYPQCYDNETGKGDHRHYGKQEARYYFQSIERLIEDFRNDCVRLADWEW